MNQYYKQEALFDLPDAAKSVAQVPSDLLEQQMQVMLSHNSVRYGTPPAIIEAARATMGSIDLDPASEPDFQEIVQAERYFTPLEDGLSRPWKGNVWLNPPYSKTGSKSNQEIWADYLLTEFERGHVSQACLLTKNAQGYNWFERLWDRLPACFFRQRVSFLRPDGDDTGEAKHGTVVFYLGNHLVDFVGNFIAFGRITTPSGNYYTHGGGSK